MSYKEDYFHIGPSLYIPAIKPNLEIIINRYKAKSFIICTEDSIKESELDFSLDNIKNFLVYLNDFSKTKIFIRIRNIDVLNKLLKMSHIDKIDGFVLPKVTLNSLFIYKEIFKNKLNFSLMPTLETKEVFSDDLLKIKNILDSFKSILCIKIGVNDLMNLLHIRNKSRNTIFETPLRSVIEKILFTFKPFGYEVAASVCRFIDDKETLQREIKQDISYGLYAKAAIHPNQISFIEDEYKKYALDNIEKARFILNKSSNAVFKLDGEMIEPVCDRNWAFVISKLYEKFCFN